MHYSHGNFHNFFFGKHYRDLWALPIHIKVFDIGNEGGKMNINKKGGGFQTISLRLSDPENKKFVLRTIDKDEASILPGFLKKTFISGIVRDQTSALNPYAAFIIPPLSEAAGLYHTNPKLYFIPYDERFGQYAKEFEGRVVLFEEYPDSSWSNTEKFGFAMNIVNSEHLLKKRFSDQHVRVDERMLARARLFDIWIGDWDRHIDQWRWAERKNGKLALFKPIARDRDMAFFKINDNGVFAILSSKINNKLQSFNYDYESLEGLTKNGKYIDHLFLANLNDSDFIAIADSLKELMSDEVIEKAVASWPEPIFKKEGPDIINKLKARRNNLTKVAKSFSDLISKEVVIAGTDENESIEVERMNDKETSVKIYSKENELMFNRIFKNNITEIIRIYALKGTDKITVSGRVKKAIDIEIYGGEGYDSIADHSEVKGLRKRTKIYDTVSGNAIDFGKEAENKTSGNPCILDFDRKGLRKKDLNQ
jgi:hypothetical protein